MSAYPTLSEVPTYGFKQKSIDNTIRSNQEANYEVTRRRASRQRRDFDWPYEYLPDDDKYLLRAHYDVNQCDTEFDLLSWEEAYGDNAWQANHVYTYGVVVRPTTANGRSYMCIQAGTTDAAEPAPWGVVKNGNTADNTVIWRENTYTVKYREPIDWDYVVYGKSGVMVKMRET